MPRQPTKPSRNTEDLEIISKSIVAILEHKHTELALSPLHARVNSLVTNLKFNELTQKLTENISIHFRKWCNELDALTGPPLITKFALDCKDFKSYCDILPKLYAQYDDQAIKLNKALKDESMTLTTLEQYFYDIVMCDNERTKAIISILLSGIEKCRINDDYSSADIKTAIEIFYHFKAYSERTKNIQHFNIFFGDFIAQTKKFYDDFFKTNYLNSEFPAFLKNAMERLQKEEKLLNTILLNDKEKNEEMKKCREENVIVALRTAHQAAIFSHEADFVKKPEDNSPPKISTALIEKDISPLKWLINDSYIKFEKSTDNFVKTCAEYTCTEILKFVVHFNDEKLKQADAVKYIGEIMDLVLQRREPFEQVFSSNEKAKEIFTEYVRKGWNNEKFDIVKNFVNYIDSNIRSEFKNLSAGQQAAFPDRCAKFFSYTEDKLPFGKTYEMSFVQRLIKMGEKLKDIEAPIIEKIRKEKNADFMRNFNQLTQSVVVSNELAAEFKSNIAKKGNVYAPGTRQIDFSPLIINKTIFSLHICEEKAVPSFLAPINSAFISEYQNKNKMAKLTLLADNSTVESKWKVPPNDKSKVPVTYTLITDIVCAKIIYCVATHKECTLAQINDEVQEDRTLVCKYIMKLCTAFKILHRSHFKDKKLSDDDVFEMFKGFFSKNKRVLIPSQINVRKENEKQNNANIEQGKTQLIKATIVRILKQKNRVSQKEVEDDTIVHMSKFFKPDVSLIRKQLTLLERNSNDDGYFHREGTGENEVLVYHQ